MTKKFPILLLVLLFPVSVLCQNPSATPADDDVVKITTTLVQVDVTVTDKKGRPVTDLRPDEFEIYENGKKQEITNFSFVSSKRRSPGEEDGNKAGIDLPATRRTIDPRDVRRTIALVVDDLSMSFESTHYVRQALRNFVNNQMQDGDLVAIVRTGGGVGALQQFTMDRDQLRAAIEKIRFDVTGVANSGPFAPTAPDLVAENQRDLAKETGSELTKDEGSLDDYRRDMFLGGTLGALSYLVRGMQELPGRKSILMLSDGISLFKVNSAGFPESTRLLDQLRGLVDLCNRSSVVVYTIDAKGLIPMAFASADSLGNAPAVEIEQKLLERTRRLFESREGLSYIAEQTGGEAYYNTNDFKGSIQKMLEDTSYYLIGYQPDDDSFDRTRKKFNNLQVKVTRPGVRVRYRSGYYGMENRDRMKYVAEFQGNRRLAYALSSPFAVNDLGLDLHAVFKGEDRKKLSVDAFIHIDLSDMKLDKDADGKQKATYDVMVMNFDENGLPRGATSTTATIDPEKVDLDKIRKEGLVVTVTFPVKKPGGYQVRAAARENGTGKIGTASKFILVPNLGKKRLTLSGIVVDDISYSKWNNTAGKSDLRFRTVGDKSNGRDVDQFNDTALRRFQRGTILTYTYEAYNVRARQNGELRVRSRLVKDGKVIFSGKESEVDLRASKDGKKVTVQGALNLGKSMEPGDYALQVIVTDDAAKKRKYQTATQYLQFEIVD